MSGQVDPTVERSVDAVIFDFGGVFVDSPFTAAITAAAELGVEPEHMLDTVFGPYDQDTDHAWHRLERGEITLEQARDSIMAASVAAGGPELDPIAVLMAVGGGGVRAGMVDFTRSLRTRGIRTGLLTNNAKEFAAFWRPLLPLDELFDDVVDSSDVGLRKPDPRIYQLSLDRLGVRADRAVFIDDAPGNVDAATLLGIAAVLIGPHPSDEAEALASLARLTA